MLQWLMSNINIEEEMMQTIETEIIRSPLFSIFFKNFYTPGVNRTPIPKNETLSLVHSQYATKAYCNNSRKVITIQNLYPWSDHQLSLIHSLYATEEL